MAENTSPSQSLGIEKIREFLPHRYPFLLIDRVDEIFVPPGQRTLHDHPKTGIRVVARKNVSINEPFFNGHFPGFAIMPGVLLVEAMAQTASMAVYPLVENNLAQIKGFQSILVGVDEARFRRPVVPGDCLRLTAEVTKCRGKLWSFDCSIECEGHRVAEAKILANLEGKAS